MIRAAVQKTILSLSFEKKIFVKIDSLAAELLDEHEYNTTFTLSILCEQYLTHESFSDI